MYQGTAMKIFFEPWDWWACGKTSIPAYSEVCKNLVVRVHRTAFELYHEPMESHQIMGLLILGQTIS